jgi:hypothetical protein
VFFSDGVGQPRFCQRQRCVSTAAQAGGLGIEIHKIQSPERLKQYCGHLERGFLCFGEASAKEQVQSNPVTEPKRSQNPKGPLLSSIQPDG